MIPWKEWPLPDTGLCLKMGAARPGGILGESGLPRAPEKCEMDEVAGHLEAWSS